MNTDEQYRQNGGLVTIERLETRRGLRLRKSDVKTMASRSILSCLWPASCLCSRVLGPVAGTCGTVHMFGHVIQSIVARHVASRDNLVCLVLEVVCRRPDFGDTCARANHGGNCPLTNSFSRILHAVPSLLTRAVRGVFTMCGHMRRAGRRSANYA